MLRAALEVPDEHIDATVTGIHQGNCPVCGGPGPVDIHTAYRAVSLIAVTFWKPVERLSCRRCGVKFLLYNLVVTFFFGWWGVPTGVAVTPIYLCCNVGNLLFPVSPHRPSAELTQHVKTELGKQMLAGIGRSAP